MPGKHTAGPVGLARLLPSRIRLRTIVDRARTAATGRRNRAVGAAVVLLLVAGGVALFTGERSRWPLFVAPIVPAGEGTVAAVPEPTVPLGSAAATLAVSDERPSTPGADASIGSGRGQGPQPGADPGRSQPAVSRRPAPATGGLTAEYVVTGSWDTGFVAGTLLTNRTDRAQSWRVVVGHDPGAAVLVTNAWNATIERAGPTTIFTGGPLAPGASQTFGFEATKRVTGPVRPTSCTVNGVPCSVR